MLTLSDIVRQPKLMAYEVRLEDGEKLSFRPLDMRDVPELAEFLEGLSPETRRLSTFDSYDLTQAEELCDAINKYDKLRFVIQSKDKRIVGLIELSFGLPSGDIERFKNAGIDLNPEADLRFGPTLADNYQGKGVGSKIFPLVVQIAQRFDKKRIILWGGVLEDNLRAIRYYEKCGFKRIDTFEDNKGVKKLDMILEI